nr:MAG TPA: hypothetical protein [Crassvirales sp.]
MNPSVPRIYLVGNTPLRSFINLINFFAISTSPPIFTSTGLSSLTS